MKISDHVPISTLTTMQLGGYARHVAVVENLEDIKSAYQFAAKHCLPVFILGLGANVIGLDQGFDGLIILNRLRGIKILSSSAEHLEVEAMGGEIWDDLVKFTAERGYSGIEAMAKIPGTIGAAPVQNIGAYGQEIKDTITKALVFDTVASEFIELTSADMKFDYRRSIFNQPPTAGRYFIASITLKLHKRQLKPPFYTSLQQYVDQHQITDFSPLSIYNMVSAVRSAKLPDPDYIPSAGSFFKNFTVAGPEAERLKSLGVPLWEAGVTSSGEASYTVNSGWLIEHSGLKGRNFSGFIVSDKAALILINSGTNPDTGRPTTCADLSAAKSAIIRAVEDKFGVTLAQEPVELCVSASPRPLSSSKKSQSSSVKLLSGAKIADFIKERQFAQVRVLRARRITPKLVILRDSSDPVISKYVSLKKRYGSDIGIVVDDIITSDIPSALKTAAADPTVHAIIVQLPLKNSSGLDLDQLLALIPSAKDVDGLGKNGKFDSATATAINWLLASYNIELTGRKIAVVGKGRLVGAPLIKIWQSSGQDVTVFDRRSDLTELSKFDIIVTGTGVPRLIKPEMVKSGAVIVDAGTASEDDVIIGDVDPEVRNLVHLSAITPIIGGVGPLTVAVLFENVIAAALASDSAKNML